MNEQMTLLRSMSTDQQIVILQEALLGVGWLARFEKISSDGIPSSYERSLDLIALLSNQPFTLQAQYKLGPETTSWVLASRTIFSDTRHWHRRIMHKAGKWLMEHSK